MPWRTAAEFAGRTTIHGLAYIVDRDIPQPLKVLWMTTVLLCGGLAISISVNSYTEWKADQVIKI